MQNRCRKNLIGLLQWLPLCAGLMQGELKLELLLSDIVFRVWKTPKGWFRACLVIVSSYCVFTNTQNRSQSSLKHGKKFNCCLRKEHLRNIIIKEKETVKIGQLMWHFAKLRNISDFMPTTSRHHICDEMVQPLRAKQEINKDRTT